MNQTPTQPLFAKALEIMNQAIEAHKDSTIYRKLFEACQAFYGGKLLGVSVYKDKPDNEIAFHKIIYDNYEFTLMDGTEENPSTVWKVSEDYLQKIVDHPDEYINHPEKLDWDWLKDRLGF